jgi:dTDP-4-dehydrorhamnose reductase
MVCGGVTSRLEVAQEVIRILGLEATVTINEVTSDYFKEEYFALRPASERLVNSKLELRGLNRMRDWRTALREYLNTEYEGYLDARADGV